MMPHKKKGNKESSTPYFWDTFHCKFSGLVRRPITVSWALVEADLCSMGFVTWLLFLRGP